MPYSMSSTRMPVLLAAVLVSTSAAAEDVPRGELSAAIRSAGHACANVTEVKPHGTNAWTVTCNSGDFSVKRGGDGSFAVTPKG